MDLSNLFSNQMVLFHINKNSTNYIHEVSVRMARRRCLVRPSIR